MTGRSTAWKIGAMVLMILLAMSLAGAVPSASASQTFEGSIRSKPRIPMTLSEGGRQVLGLVDFGRQFSSIDSACFVFTFKRNLLEVDEGVEIALSHKAPQGSGFGFINPGPDTQASRTICLAAGYHDEELAGFRDGKQDFVLRMFSGSVRISDLEVVVTGTSI